MQRVDGIEPYNGWLLMWMEYFETDRYNTDWYEAHHPEHGTRLLQTTGRGFIPTQARFEFLGTMSPSTEPSRRNGNEQVH